MKVIVITDSMSMPRNNIRYEDTWYYKLKHKLKSYKFIDKEHRGSMSNRLVSEGGGFANILPGSDLLEFYNPDIIIIQLGIVDCSPRYISIYSFGYKVLTKLPFFLQKIYYNFKKKYSKRSSKNAYISPQIFHNNYKNFINRAIKLNSKIIITEISPVSTEFQIKSPEINISIKRYNNILKKLSDKNENVFLFSPFYEFQSNFLIDELHYSKIGHHNFYVNLLNLIKNIS